MSVNKILAFETFFDLLSSSEKMFTLIKLSQKLSPIEQLFVSSVIKTNAQAHLGKDEIQDRESFEETQQHICNGLKNSDLPKKDLEVFTNLFKEFKRNLQNPIIGIASSNTNNPFMIKENPFQIHAIIQLLGQTGERRDLKILRQLSKAHLEILSPVYFDKCGLTVGIIKPERTETNLFLDPRSRWNSEMCHLYRKVDISLGIQLEGGHKVLKVFGNESQKPPYNNLERDFLPMLKQNIKTIFVHPYYYHNTTTLLEIIYKFSNLKEIELAYNRWNYDVFLANLNYLLDNFNLKLSVNVILRVHFPTIAEGGAVPNEYKMERLILFFVQLSVYENVKFILDIIVCQSNALFDLFTQLVLDYGHMMKGVNISLKLREETADISKPQVESNLIKLSPFLTGLSYYERYTRDGILWDFSHLNCPRIKKS